MAAALLAQVGRCEFDPKGFEVIEGEPIVYWWSGELLKQYERTEKLGERHTVRYGLSTQNNTRWLRSPWEVHRADVMLKSFDDPIGWDGHKWVTYIKGSEGRVWCDEISDIVLWHHSGLELATYPDNHSGEARLGITTEVWHSPTLEQVFPPEHTSAFDIRACCWLCVLR